MFGSDGCSWVSMGNVPGINKFIISDNLNKLKFNKFMEISSCVNSEPFLNIIFSPHIHGLVQFIYIIYLRKIKIQQIYGFSKG